MATAGQPHGEVCPRCTLAIKKNAGRCPHCGERLHSTRFPLYAGIVGLLVLVFVAILMINTIGEEDANSDDPTTQQQQTAQPDKPPPFNK